MYMHNSISPCNGALLSWGRRGGRTNTHHSSVTTYNGNMSVGGNDLGVKW